MAWVMKTTLLRQATTAALPRIQNPRLSRKQGMLSFAPSPLLIFVFSSEQRSWKTLWKECHSVCIFFTYYILEKLFRTSLSLTLPSPSDAASCEVKFSLASPEWDSGKPRLQEAVSITALWVCHCGYGRSYKTQAATWLLEAGTCFSWVPSPIRKMGPSMELVYRLEGSCLLIFMFHCLFSVVSCFLNCFVSFVTTARGINSIQTLIMFMGLSHSGLEFSKLPGLPPEFCFITFTMKWNGLLENQIFSFKQSFSSCAGFCFFVRVDISGRRISSGGGSEENPMWLTEAHGGSPRSDVTYDQVKIQLQKLGEDLSSGNHF